MRLSRTTAWVGLTNSIYLSRTAGIGASSPFVQTSPTDGFPPTGDLLCPSESLLKTRVFEKGGVTGKFHEQNRLNVSQNSFLISASQKARVRLSFERGHDDQTDKDRSHSRAGEAATFRRGQGRASAIIRCRRHHVEADAARLCPRVDRRPEPCLAAGRPDRSRVRKDFHRADVWCGYTKYRCHSLCHLQMSVSPSSKSGGVRGPAILAERQRIKDRPFPTVRFAARPAGGLTAPDRRAKAYRNLSSRCLKNHDDGWFRPPLAAHGARFCGAQDVQRG
jgi:hypothetical protein